MIPKTKGPATAPTVPSHGPLNPTQGNDMNMRTNSTISDSMQNLTVGELVTFTTATRRLMDALDGISSMPRCVGSGAVSELLDAEYDRLGERLEAAAGELARRQPATSDEIEERVFALTSLAAAHRMTLPEFLEQFQEEGE